MPGKHWLLELRNSIIKKGCSKKACLSTYTCNYLLLSFGQPSASTRTLRRKLLVTEKRLILVRSLSWTRCLPGVSVTASSVKLWELPLRQGEWTSSWTLSSRVPRAVTLCWPTPLRSSWLWSHPGVTGIIIPDSFPPWHCSQSNELIFLPSS